MKGSRQSQVTLVEVHDGVNRRRGDIGVCVSVWSIYSLPTPLGFEAVSRRGGRSREEARRGVAFEACGVHAIGDLWRPLQVES